MKLALAFVPLALTFSASASARIDPSTFGSLAFRQHPGAQLPLAARFIDETGRDLSLGAALGGKPTIVVLEYLRCQNLCSLVLSGTTAALVRAHLTPGRDVNLVAVSIDPNDTSRDVAAAAAMYSRRFPNPALAQRGIRFLTGSPDQVRRVAAVVGFPYRLDVQSKQYAHPAGFVVTTSEGRISRYMLGLNPSARMLSGAIAAAGAGSIKPAVHPLLCLCFGYDPDEGSVAALSWRLAQMVSACVMLLCAGLVAGLALRRKLS